MTLPFWLEILVSTCLILGSLFALVGSFGLARLPDFYTRLHAPTKATTLGVGGILIGSALYFSHQDFNLSIHELLITIFLLITAPVSAHLLAKAAMHQELPQMHGTQGEALLKAQGHSQVQSNERQAEEKKDSEKGGDSTTASHKIT
ncbi:Na+/H+ antiporter subunit G [Terasakiispira papahanaumokuakeensis]|uniref:Na+/H+ antiporter subunit G n=1 Tax=Terasakiispira papahanaumokuakeensis TaxID=197479 RepID=UPI000A005052|nr:Na+/H+ antiporter subunit G [Terasakiispira papahanaumokuakeensis]